MPVPNPALGPDETLSPGESFVLHLEVGLSKINQFEFFVNAFKSTSL